MRGKVHPGSLCCMALGITPAHAGKSGTRYREVIRNQDHPRACGEKSRSCGFHLRFPGSPPRVRGKGSTTHRTCDYPRITPACAGKSGLSFLPLPALRDHPRVCGKKVTVIRSQTINEGSPPPVRGKDTGGGLNLPVAGITPACAGKRLTCINDSAFREDHPRVCGEKDKAAEKAQHLRGKGNWHYCILVFTGITPARAGKSLTIPNLTTRSWDHPRACGEKQSQDERKTP